MRLLLAALLLLPVAGWAFSPARSPECDANPEGEACKAVREENRKALANWNCMNELNNDYKSPAFAACVERRLSGQAEPDKKVSSTVGYDLPEQEPAKEYWR